MQGLRGAQGRFQPTHLDETLIEQLDVVACGCVLFFWNPAVGKAQDIEPADCISPTGKALWTSTTSKHWLK